MLSPSHSITNNSELIHHLLSYNNDNQLLYYSCSINNNHHLDHPPRIGSSYSCYYSNIIPPPRCGTSSELDAVREVTPLATGL